MVVKDTEQYLYSGEMLEYFSCYGFLLKLSNAIILFFATRESTQRLYVQCLMKVKNLNEVDTI